MSRTKGEIRDAQEFGKDKHLRDPDHHQRPVLSALMICAHSWAD
ncbi:hypothetical protein [Streptomyces sp. NPDC020681]